jgi:hypothetical protein
VRLALKRTSRGCVRALLWLSLAGLVLGAAGPRSARALDPIGLDGAATEVRAVLEDMAAALNGAPRDVQTALSADLHLMSQAITRALDRLDDRAVPIIDPTLVYDLNFLADIARAATDELQAIGAQDDRALDAAHVERIDALTDAAAARLVEVNLVIDGWTERGRNAVVELDEQGGAVVVRSTDRLVYNGVRFTSIGLLLVGLLVVGLQLLRMSEDRVDSLSLLRETPLLSSLAVIALTAFFAGCVVFSLRPGTLAALSAEVRQQPQEHPCERLAAQRDRLVAAQQVEHAGLVEATMERMGPAARDCLGLPSEAATAEAVEVLAAKTALADSTPQPARPVGVAVAVAEPHDRASDADAMTLPAMPAPTPDEPAAVASSAPSATPESAAGQPAAEPASAGAESAEAESTDAAVPKPDDLVAEVAAITPALGPKPATDAQEAEGSPAPEPAAGPADSMPQLKPADLTAEPPAAGVDGGESELYVTTTAVNYRAGPSVDARRLGTFIAGAQLAVVDEDEGWSEVRLGDGRQVFVATEFLEPAP